MVDTETVLLTRFTRTGDAQAFAEITRRHAGLVYGAALRVLADVDRAADVAQETFLQLTKDAPRVTGSLSGWLHRVATHKAIDQMRRESSRRRRETEYLAEQPREVADWKDLSRYVDEQISKLDEETRDMLVAHFLQGRTTRQIAMSRGVSQATVSRRVDAGVTRLRGMLRKRGILVAAGVLSALLGENAAQAAPPALMAELGKIALVGGHAAAASAGASTVQTLLSGALAGVKAKVVVAAAVAVVGAGSVVTYQQVTRPPSSESTVETRSPVSKAASRTVVSEPVSSPQPAPAPSAGPSNAAARWAELMGGAVARNGQPPQEPAPQPAADAPPVEGAATTPEGGFGGMGRGLAMGGAVSTSQQDQQQEEPVPQGGGMFYYYSAGPTPAADSTADSNDSNDTDADASE